MCRAVFEMQLSRSYVLVFDHQLEDAQLLGSLFDSLRCPMIVASSADQVIDRINQAPPYLLILAGNPQTLSPSLLNNLRTTADTFGITLLALSDCHAPSWVHQDENPGFDGFLVKPLSGDILGLLVQSARVRQTYRLAG
jgi:DNA-binding NarL/FixJ family response regulator